MLCVVDDAHWLDPATADALLFCARRLGADRVLMVFSARDGAATPFRPDGIGELRADRARPGCCPRPARPAPRGRTGAGGHRPADRRDAAATRWLCWSCRPSSAADQLGGSSPLPAQLHLTTRVEQAFLDRSRRLSADGAGSAAARGRRRHRRARRRSAGQRRPSVLDEQALEAAVASGLLVAGRAGRGGAAPAGPVGDLPGRHRRATTTRAPRAGRRPGRSSETPTARRGIAPPPPTGPTTTSSPPSSASGPVPSVAAGTPPP